MGPDFCAASETIADIANEAIATNSAQVKQHLYVKAEAMDFNAIYTPYIYEKYQLAPLHPRRNPLLSFPSPKRLAVVNVFVADYIASIPRPLIPLPFDWHCLYAGTRRQQSPLKGTNIY